MITQGLKLWVCLLAGAASAPAAPETQRAGKPAGPVRLTIQPVPLPKPALRYLLLPDLLDQSPGNAAQLYDVAATVYQNENRGDLPDRVAKWLDVPLAQLPREQVRQLLVQYPDTLRSLRLASRREYCRWEIVRSEGFKALLPSLATFRAIAKVQALQIRLNIAESHFDEAIEGLQTGMAMARDVGNHPTLIGNLVGRAMTGLMLERVQELEGAAGAPNLFWALTDLPRPFIDMRDGLQWERAAVFLTMPRLATVGTAQNSPDELQNLLEEVLHWVHEATVSTRPGAAEPVLDISKLAPKGKEYLVSHGRAREQVERMSDTEAVLTRWVDEYRVRRDNGFKWLNLPYWQADAGLREYDQELDRDKADNPLQLLPKLRHAYFQVLSGDRTIAALSCIEALRAYAAEHGELPASLSDIRALPVPVDPISDKPFEYRREAPAKAVLQAAWPPEERATEYELILSK